MTNYEVRSISNWIRLLNQDTEQESSISILAATGQTVTVLHLITSKLDSEMAIIELGDEHAIVRWDADGKIVRELDLLTLDDELVFAIDDSSGPMPEVSRREDMVGFVVRLAE